MTHFRGISFTLTRIFDSLTEFMTQISFILIYLLAIGALRSVDYGHIVTCDIRGCKNYIGRQLARTKRDLIGWNRAHNTVHQYGRHKTAGDDFMPYVKQYKKFMMKLNPENRQELRKALKTIRQRRNAH